MKLSCIFAVIIWAMWLLLLILSRREAGDLWHRPFLYIYKKGCMLPFVKSYIQSGERQIVKNLISLHPGGTPMQLLTEYYVEKLRLVIGILLMGSMIAF